LLGAVGKKASQSAMPYIMRWYNRDLTLCHGHELRFVYPMRFFSLKQTGCQNTNNHDRGKNQQRIRFSLHYCYSPKQPKGLKTNDPVLAYSAASLRVPEIMIIFLIMQAFFSRSGVKRGTSPSVKDETVASRTHMCLQSSHKGIMAPIAQEIW
jgi:hypothetical protein